QHALISHCSPSCAASRLFDTSGGQVFTQPLRRFWRREMVGSLEGVRVLELARYQAGPRGGMILSDLGAEVIKIEKLGGEETRKSEPLVRGQSVYFSVYNRGKKSLCLDMRTERGKEIFAALVPTADMVLQNFRRAGRHPARRRDLVGRPLHLAARDDRRAGGTAPPQPHRRGAGRRLLSARFRVHDGRDPALLLSRHRPGRRRGRPATLQGQGRP